VYKRQGGFTASAHGGIGARLCSWGLSTSRKKQKWDKSG
jgi:hypothetical protein